MKRIIAVLLAAVLLISVFPIAFAQEQASTDAELIAQYHIPDNWARPALLFAVRNGLLGGKGAEGLAPEDTATRAEIATILMRIIQTETEADLSGFRDMRKDEWFYVPMSRAVAVGILNGSGNAQMLPNTNITREQTFAVLSRAFGIQGGQAEDLFEFSDWTKVSDWAVSSMTAMVHSGYVSGGDGKLNPQANITRQEFAQVLYNLLDGLGTEIPEEFSGTYALAADEIEPGTVVHGDLILCGEGAELNLEDVTVEGRLVIQGCGSVVINLKNCAIAQLQLCRDAQVYSDGSAELITVNRNAAVYGEIPAVTVAGGSLEITQEAQVGTLCVCAAGSQITVNGTVSEAELLAENILVIGSGSIGQMKVCRKDCSVRCSVENLTEEIITPLAGVQAKRADTAVPTAANPSATLRVVFSQEDHEAVYENCRVCWIVDGKIVRRDTDVSITDGTETSLTMDFSKYLDLYHAFLPVQVILLQDDQKVYCEFSVDVSEVVKKEAEKVHTSYVRALVPKTVGLFHNYNDYKDSLYNWFRDIPGGTEVNFIRTYIGASRIMLDDGTTGWVKSSDIRLLEGPAYTTADYPAPVKEYFVNYVKNYTSKTKYLIWVNIWTQQVNIFTGSAGNWKLIRTADCATGKQSTPTTIGTRSVVSKTLTRSGGGYYYHHLTWTEGQIAFHSRLYYNGGGFYDATIGRPVSNGCIRLYDEDCIWIYDNIPYGTTVIVY